MNKRRPDNSGRPADPRTAIPTPVRIAGWISAGHGLLGVLAAIVLVIRALGGHREETVVINGYATAAWFVILGGALLAAGLGDRKSTRLNSSHTSKSRMPSSA